MNRCEDETLFEWVCTCGKMSVYSPDIIDEVSSMDIDAMIMGGLQSRANNRAALCVTPFIPCGAKHTFIEWLFDSHELQHVSSNQSSSGLTQATVDINLWLQNRDPHLGSQIEQCRSHTSAQAAFECDLMHRWCRERNPLWPF